MVATETECCDGEGRSVLDKFLGMTKVMATLWRSRRLENWSMGFMWPWTGYGNTKQWGFFFSIFYGVDLFFLLGCGCGCGCVYQCIYIG